MLNGKTFFSASRAGYPDRSRRIFDPQLDISNRGYVRTGWRHHLYRHVHARITAMYAGPEPADFFGAQVKDGRFEILRLPPGRYASCFFQP